MCRSSQDREYNKVRAISGPVSWLGSSSKELSGQSRKIFPVFSGHGVSSASLELPLYCYVLVVDHLLLYQQVGLIVGSTVLQSLPRAIPQEVQQEFLGQLEV